MRPGATLLRAGRGVCAAFATVVLAGLLGLTAVVPTALAQISTHDSYGTNASKAGKGPGYHSHLGNSCVPDVPLNTVAPKITPAEAVAGATLGTDNGAWANTTCNPAPTSYQYQWKRDGTVVGTLQTYAATKADVDHTISLTVAGCNANGCATAVTASNSDPIMESSLGDRNQYTFSGEIEVNDQESLHVNVANGNLILEANDFQLPGIAGLKLNYARHYNSAYSSLSSLSNQTIAPGWENLPNIALFSNGDARYADETGYETTFKKSGSSFITTPGIDATLINQADGTYLLTFHESGLQEKFSSFGRILDSIDANGNTIAYTWSGGHVSSITDSTSRTTTLTYNGSGQVTTITDPANHTYQYTYDSTSGNLLTYTDPSGDITTYTYNGTGGNGSGLLASVKNNRGWQTQISYDAQNRVTLVTSGLNSTGVCPSGHQCPKTGFTYGVAGSGGFCTGSATTDVKSPSQYPSGAATRYCFDGRMRVTSTKDAMGNITSTDYQSDNGGSNCSDANGHTLDDLPCSTTDGRGHITTYGYDATSGENMLWSQAPTQTSTHRPAYVYGDSTNPYLATQYTDANGHITNYTYDSHGNLLTEAAPIGTTTYTYDTQGQLASGTDPKTKTTTYTYDNNGNLASETDPLGHQTTYGYDSAGNRTSDVSPRGNVTGATAADYTTTFDYDAAGRLLKETDPDPDGSGSLTAAVTSYTYDGAGNQITTTDANQVQVSDAFDGNNRMTSETDGASNITTYGYDADGNLTSKTDARLNETTYSYNAADEMTSEIDPIDLTHNATTTYTYDANGNQATKTVPLDTGSATITYGYDDANRKTSVTYSGGPTTPALGLGYDYVGNRTSMTDGSGSVSYGYDGNDRLTSAARGTDTFAYVYDADGNVTSRTYPDNTQATYSYNSDGSLFSVTSGGVVTTYNYDADGNLAKTTLPSSNGYIETRTYDRADRLTDVKTANGTSTLAEFAYTLDPVGNPTQVAQSGADTCTSTYTYYNSDWLHTASFSPDCPGGSTAPSSLSWTYDGSGNRATQTQTVNGTQTTASYTYNAGDQMTSDGTNTYTYDKSGNEITAGSRSYSYDLENRLTATWNSTSRTDYTHDGDGNLMSAANGTSTTNYLWDINTDLPQLAMERNASGTLLRRYIYGMNRVSVLSSGNTYYYAYDRLGSVADLISADGANHWSYAYNPYGDSRSAGTSTALNPMRYAGQYLDPTVTGTNQYQMGARLYDPSLGRFSRTDPANDGYAPMSPYTYADDQPTVLTDPSGYDAWWGRDRLNAARKHDARVLLGRWTRLHKAMKWVCKSVPNSPACHGYRMCYFSPFGCLTRLDSFTYQDMRAYAFRSHIPQPVHHGSFGNWRHRCFKTGLEGAGGTALAQLLFGEHGVDPDALLIAGSIGCGIGAIGL
jgi:RHS repeat-associated protein